MEVVLQIANLIVGLGAVGLFVNLLRPKLVSANKFHEPIASILRDLESRGMEKLFCSKDEILHHKLRGWKVYKKWIKLRLCYFYARTPNTGGYGVGSPGILMVKKKAKIFKEAYKKFGDPPC